MKNDMLERESLLWMVDDRKEEMMRLSIEMKDERRGMETVEGRTNREKEVDREGEREGGGREGYGPPFSSFEQ